MRSTRLLVLTAMLTLLSTAPARAAGVEEQGYADLIVINGNPIATPAEIRRVTLVFKDGVGYDSAKLIDSVKGIVGIR